MSIADTVVTPSITFKAAQRGPESIQFSVFRGSMQLTIFSNKSRAFGQSINPHIKARLKGILKSMPQAQPGSKRSVVVQSWDKESKTRGIACSIIIGKNDKQGIYMEVQWKDQKSGQTGAATFDIQSSSFVSSGADPDNDQTLSALGVEILLDWIDNIAPIGMVMSGKKFERSSGGGSRGYNNSGGGSSQASGQSFGNDNGGGGHPF